MRKALQQGQADGLCGLYAVLHFLNSTSWKEQSQEGLRYLLESCQRFGWLTPETIAYGFEDDQLKAILDDHLERYRLQFRSYFFDDIPKRRRDELGDSLIETVIERGGAVVVRTLRDHWVLVRGSKGVPEVWDSSYSDPNPKPLTARRISRNHDVGLVILPFERQPALVDF